MDYATETILYDLHHSPPAVKAFITGRQRPIRCDLLFKLASFHFAVIFVKFCLYDHRDIFNGADIVRVSGHPNTLLFS